MLIFLNYNQKKIKKFFLTFFLIVLSLISFSSRLMSEEVRLFDLQKILLRENLRIKAMQSEVEMLKKKILPSKSLDDPKLKLAINNMPLNDFSLRNEDMTSKEIGISQMIPLGGKLNFKEEIALKEYYKALERLRKERIENLNMLRMNYYELSYLKNAQKTVNEMKEYFKLLIDIETNKTKSGMGDLTNVIKANLEKTMLEEEIITLYQKEKEVSKNIFYLLGREFNIQFENYSTLKITNFDKDEIIDRALKNNPDLKILTIDREISELEIKLREKEYYPDIEISVSYMQRDNSADGMKRTDMLNAMAVLNIPLWYKTKNTSMIAEMQRKKSVIENLIEDKKNELKAKIETILSEIKKWEELYKLYKDELINQSELALDVIISRYKNGLTDLMVAIETIKMLLKYKKEILMINKEYLSSISNLNSLIGVEILE